MGYTSASVGRCTFANHAVTTNAAVRFAFKSRFALTFESIVVRATGTAVDIQLHFVDGVDFGTSTLVITDKLISIPAGATGVLTSGDLDYPFPGVFIRFVRTSNQAGNSMRIMMWEGGV